MLLSLVAPPSTDKEPTTAVAAATENAGAEFVRPVRGVTLRAFLLGLVFTAGIAWMNCYFVTKYNVHMIGGIQMPLGSIFILLFMVLAINLLLRGLGKMGLGRFLPEFSPAELLTIYSMSIFGALVSTSGCDNVFLVSGPALFYFATPENGWAQLFNKYVPAWFAPGWNGSTYDKSVIDPVYVGGLTADKIPWHAWGPMLTGWGIFLFFVYALMFFTALMFRKQWTQREALPFPLVEVPVQMASGDTRGQSPPTASFWGNRAMWAGLLLAIFVHLFKGMNALYPDWPIFPVNMHGSVRLLFTERPWNAMPAISAELYLGGIGLAYLLTREVSFSFWFFFLLMGFTHVAAQMLGFSVEGMQRAGIMGRPSFIIYQSTGAWIMMAVILTWTAREYIGKLFRQAFGANRGDADEPYSPRFIVFGFLLSLIGLLAWSWFAGINLLIASTFFVLFLVTSLVLTRTVIEGGFMFPQPPYYTLEVMTNGIFGSSLNADSLTKLSFVQPMLMVDMRTSVLPAFLHTMKMAEVLRLEPRQVRRLLAAVVVALAVTVAVTVIVSLQVLYQQGGLIGYTWFSKGAPETTFKTAADTIKSAPGIDLPSVGWMFLGAFIVFLLVQGRSRFLWFPLHPLGYLVAPAYPVTRLWFSFFLGWLIKSLIMKYGGSDTYVKLRPFMIGMIIGNIVAMLFWSMFTFWRTGAPLGYWPA